MPFSLEERTALLALKGVGPTVITRLEQMGIESLDTTQPSNVGTSRPSLRGIGLDVLEEQPTSARCHHCGRGACKTQPAAVNAFNRLPQGLLADYLRGLAWLHRRQHD